VIQQLPLPAACGGQQAKLAEEEEEKKKKKKRGVTWREWFEQL
jgi:hypothetical protein